METIPFGKDLKILMSRYGQHSAKKPPRKSKKKKGLRVTLIVILVLVLAALAAGYAIFHHLYGLMNTPGKQPQETATPAAAVVTPTPAPIEEYVPESTPEPLTEEEQAALAEIELMASLQQDAEEIIYSDDVYNILLLGADGTSDQLERSDAMLLLSINKSTKSIWITSLMRDTEVTIPGWGLGHLNWATSYQDVDLLIATIESEKNFAIHIDNWALVNFLDFAELADMLGPVTVTVKPEEVENMNQLIRQVCQMKDRKYGLVGVENTTPRCYFPEGGGTFEITDGIQILGYCRERKFGGDTGRSEKQREVLLKLFENVKKMSLKQQYELAEKVMSIITTDITEGKCASLLLSAPSMIGYEIHTQQCPVPGAFWKGRDANGLSIYNADFQVNRNFLRATIYNEPMYPKDLISYWNGYGVQVWEPSATPTPSPEPAPAS